jgi:hypothetical protein
MVRLLGHAIFFLGWMRQQHQVHAQQQQQHRATPESTPSTRYSSTPSRSPEGFGPPLTAAEHTVGKQFQSVPHVCVEQEECNNNGEKTTPERITLSESTLITATEKGASIATMAEEVCAAESLSVDRLRQLLSEEDEEDDRTLLDVFGEVTKEYLTTKVIPDTDSSCRWDWRSTQCEPACACSFEAQWGDYHLGRSCRRRFDYRELDMLKDDSGAPIAFCEIDASQFWKNRPATKRIVSLVTQTVEILQRKVRHLTRQLSHSFTNKVTRWQQQTCGDLWALHQSVGHVCLPERQIPSKTIAEKLLCGPVEFEICEDNEHENVARKVFAAL